MKFTIDSNGDKFWHNDKGEYHNIIAPAMAYTGEDACWVRNNVAHRLDSPATIYPTGGQYWAWLGKFCSEKHHTLISNMKFFTRRVQI